MEPGWFVGKEKILENYQKYLQRKEIYKKFGYDIDRERDFIFQKAQPIFGDILEVGTGKGYFSLVLAKEGSHFVSVDISEEKQNFAKLILGYLGLEGFAEFKIENAECLSFEDKSFDTIFSVNTLHHLRSPFKVIEELVRIVTFEGKIILSDFTEEGLTIVDRIYQEEGKSHKVGEVSLSKIEDYFKGRGFLVERYRTNFQQTLVAYHQII
ncbi:MAG TPA: class I SAM-dependent methyltransferase [Candidatus Omnitrophica bacterium]|nr:class I SAM-dependent methyltransferase [Candidatus Omnitrophota bacterium]